MSRACAGWVRVGWCLLLMLAPAGLSAQEYRDPPEVLRDASARGAADIRAEFDANHDAQAAAEMIEAVWDRLVFYTVADALPGEELHAVRGLRAYRYLAEIGRTDKQLGAGASGPGTTSLSEKPGIAELIALAVEHGAIERSTDGAGLTLSSSPYAFVRLIQPDDAVNYDRFGIWRRLGVSATFNLQGQDAASAGAVDFKQLAEWSLRLRILGDRSTRSPGFTRRWNTVVQPRVQERINALSSAIKITFDSTPALRAAADEADRRLTAALAAYLASSAGSPAAEREAALTDMILTALRSAVYEPVATAAIPLSQPVHQEIGRAVDRLVAAHQELFKSQEDLGGILDDLDKSLLLTAAFIHYTAAADSAYSDLKLLFEDQVAPFNAVVNAFLSIYDRPAASLGQTKVRDYGASVDLEGEVHNPFGRKGTEGVVQPITLSVGYRLSRLKAANQMVHVAQAKVSIPISAGVELPISVTYASRTDLVDEDHLRGHFGLSLDLDKLYALGRALSGN